MLGRACRAVALIAVVLGGLLLAQPALAVTHISTTTYSANTSWTAAGSPYVLDGSVTVASGATLTIDPGVIVKLNGQFRTLTVNGAISAVGTAANRIVFTSLQDDSVGGDTGSDGPTVGAPGQWYSIAVAAGLSSQFSYVDVFYGGYGSSNWGYGAVSVSGSGTLFSADHSSFRYSGSSGVLVGSGATAALSAATLSNDGNGVSVNTGKVTVADHSMISNNSQYGVWFNLPTGYSTPASSIVASDVTANTSNGIYVGANGDYPLAQLPWGTGNNIYANASGGKQLVIDGYPGFLNAAVNWTGNYWGDGVYYYYNEVDCLSTPSYASGHLAYRSSGSSPPAGPIDSSTYLISHPYPQPTTVCAVDRVNIDATQFSPTYLDGSAREPLAQSWGDCGVDDDANVEALNQTSCEADVNASSGGFTQAVTDLSLPGIGVAFALTRTYNSLDRTPGPLGRGWTFSYGAQLGILSNGDVSYRSGTGQQLYYAKQGSSFVTPPGARSSLTLSGGVYDLARYDQVHERFDSSGRLLSIKDRNNQGLTFTYNGSSQLTTITDSVGRSISLTYDATSGRLTHVGLPDGRGVSYAFTDGLLSSVTDVRSGTTTYTYEPHGWLKKGVDQNLHTIFELTYGNDGRVLTQKDGLGKTTGFSWDQSTQTQTATDPRGKAWKDVFSNGLLLKRIDPLGNTTQYAYDTDLNQTSITDARGKTTTYTYDGHGNTLTRTAPSPLSYQETWTYNGNNDPVTYTDGRGKTTSYGYDSAGNLTSKTQPGSIVTAYGRDANGTGLLVSTTDPRSKTTTFGYDASGNLTSITTALGNKTTMASDGSGRLTSRVDPRGNVTGANPADYTTSFTYNNADQKLTQTDANGHTTTRVFDAVGNLSSVTDANSHATSYAYDADNRLTSVTAPGSVVTSYGYDDNGNLTSRTNSNTHATSYSYDDANRLLSSTDPLTRTWSYGYDANGNRTTVTNPGSAVSTSSYDALKRLTGIDYSDTTPDVSISYDGDNNRTQMTDGAGTVSYSYDDLNRLTAVTRGSDTFSYGYDDANNLTSRTHPGGTATSYGYDNDERLTSATSGGATTSYGYDPAAQLIQTTRPSGNGWNETRSYDHAGQLTQIKDANATSTLQQLDYAYDPIGNATSLTRLSGAEYYQYDNRDRLTKVCYDAACASATDTIGWTYDGVGNRLTETRPAGTTTYTYDAADQLTQTSGPGGTTGYSYDTSGNETAAGARSYTYDLASRPVSTTSGSATTSYSYDGDGNRLSANTGSATTNYLWDTNNGLPQLALERNGSGSTLRSYMRGLDTIALNEGGTTYFYHHDRLGSVTALTSSAGAMEWTYTYEPFGASRTTTQPDPNAPINPLAYVGQYQDPTSSLLDLRARQYDEATGRFLSLDPKPAGPLTPYEATYDYANQDPINGYDLSGEMPIPANPCVAAHTCHSAGFGHIARAALKSTTARFLVAGLATLACPETAGLGCAIAAGAIAGAGINSANYAVNSHNQSIGGYVKAAAVGGAEGATAGLGAYSAAGREIRLANGDVRIALGGNRGPGRFQLPHYHRRGPGGIAAHRPWEGW